MVNQTDSLDSSCVNLGTEENQEITKDRRYSGDSGIEEKEEFEVLDGENQEIQANLCDTPPEDLSLENAILTNFPDGCDRSFTVELKDEDSYDIIPKNLTFAEIINIFNQAVRGDNCEELDKVVQNIEDYEGRSITLDNVKLKSFCEQQLNLDLQDRSDHQHIYSNVLSQYKFDQENFECDYSVKELLLLAIAANDKLTERCQEILFAEGNLSLLPLLVGGQKYIEAFTEKFHSNDGVHGRLKDQAIQLVEPNKISFFSVIALRKEQELLNAIFVEYVLRDFGQVLKTSKPDPLYGVLETVSLIKNEEFITIVLGAFERYINESTKKASTEELLKKSFATLLETAISQEHISVIKYLCKRYTNSTSHAIYDVYEQAFADDKVITILRQQILKNIGARGRREIYNLVLKTALDAGNIAFIEHLCKECAECRNDVIGYLNQKFKNNEFDNIQESILIALSNVEYTNTDVIVEVLFYTEEIYQNASHNEQVIRQVIQNILKNATHYSIGQEDYSLVKGVCYLCTEEGAINVIFQEECGIFKSSIEKRIEDLEKENKLLQSEALREYNHSYLPGIVNGLAQTAYIAYDEYTKDPKDNKRRKNIDLIFSLMQIRNILQFSIDVQEYSCHERQDLWDEMHQTPGTFIIRKRSNNVADELEIPVITSDTLSENPGLESAASKQVEKDVLAQKGESDILDGMMVSIMDRISDNFEEDRVHSSDQNTRSIEKELSDAIFSLDYKAVECLVKRVKQEDNNAERIINRALEKAHETEVGKKDQQSKNKVRKIRGFLAVESKSIGAAAGRQEVPVVEPKESESDSPNSEEEINEVRIPVIEAIESVATAMVSEMPSMATEESKSEPDNLNGEQDDQQNLTVSTVSSSVSEDVSTSRSDEEESVVITQGSQDGGEKESDHSEALKQNSLVSPERKHAQFFYCIVQDNVSTPIHKNASCSISTSNSSVNEANLSDQIGVDGASVMAEPMNTIATELNKLGELGEQLLCKRLQEIKANIEGAVFALVCEAEGLVRSSRETHHKNESGDFHQAILTSKRKLEVQEEKNTLLDGENQELLEQISQLEGNNKEFSDKMDEVNKNKGQLEEDLNGIRQKLNEVTQTLGNTRAQLKESKKELDDAKKDVSQSKQEILNQQANINDLTDRVSKFTSEKDQLKGELDTTKTQLTEKEKALNAANERVKKLEQDLKQESRKIIDLEEENHDLTDKVALLTQEKSRYEGILKSTKEEFDRTIVQLKKLEQESAEKIQAFENTKVRLEQKCGDVQQDLAAKIEELENINQKVLRLEQERDSAQQGLATKTKEFESAKTQHEKLQKGLDEKTSEVTQLTEENNKLKNELKLKKPENNNLKTKLQESESKNNGLESQIENLQKQLESKNKELNGKNERFLGAKTHSKRQGNYASVSFVLSGAFAVGASLTMFHLAICISLAVAALTFFVVGYYYSYKANTALSYVEIDQIAKGASHVTV